MWRLILQAGKFLLTKEAVPKGATELSKHASKKAGQAALDKAAKVQVKKVKPGSAIRQSGSKESEKFSKGILDVSQTAGVFLLILASSYLPNLEKTQ